jgi:hypothetical protein
LRLNNQDIEFNSVYIAYQGCFLLQNAFLCITIRTALSIRCLQLPRPLGLRRWWRCIYKSSSRELAKIIWDENEVINSSTVSTKTKCTRQVPPPTHNVPLYRVHNNEWPNAVYGRNLRSAQGGKYCKHYTASPTQNGHEISDMPLILIIEVLIPTTAKLRKRMSKSRWSHTGMRKRTETKMAADGLRCGMRAAFHTLLETHLAHAQHRHALPHRNPAGDSLTCINDFYDDLMR